MAVCFSKKVQNAFSRSASCYDRLSSLQQRIGEELFFYLPQEKDYRFILDVGMGTGRMTQKLSALFPQAKISGIDFAQGMVSWAKRQYSSFYVVQADAVHLPFRSHVFDLIYSNSAYQWVGNLKQAFQEVYRVLKRQGIFSMAMFAQKSLGELFESLEYSCDYRLAASDLPLRKLAEKNCVYEALQQSGFQDINIESRIIKVTFFDMFALLRWLKSIGANSHKEKMFLGRGVLLKANEYYKKNFKENEGVYATFEIVSVNAKK